MNLLKSFASENQRIAVLVKIICFFWLITKLWSYKTWIADRVYPVVAPFEILQEVPPSLHLIFFGLSLVILFLIIVFKLNRSLLIVLFILEIVSCSLDSVRWHPWEFMYLCFTLTVILNFSKPKTVFLLLHLFLVATFFYSGLHKLNRNFLDYFWRDHILTAFFGLSNEVILKYKLFFVGLLIPVTEIFLAFLLFFGKSKKKTSYILIALHVGILILLGPFGLNYNSIVWIWNLAMIAILFLLYQKDDITFDKTIISSQLPWMILWFIMPIYSFFGRYYQYFSFNLYSAKGTQLYICTKKSNKDLTTFDDKSFTSFCNGKVGIALQNWAMAELKSASSPELEIQQKAGQILLKKYGCENISVFLYNVDKQSMTKLSCSADH
ncbi:hypothetical protein ASG01_10300 [Chryseobacterium sp. Leaf180]|uniref:hypothetical protein n=1 Tax=Chryseobacterium sp. Leaf180 TaxID=1736289 RepID=UPI0006F97AB4|nr:hypothetical protein [Chryseobacterium sp. Leaf180]KQR93550.1 hypothetical protein ASG01_10300 [Chryseobacterium sp. Leaf180]